MPAPVHHGTRAPLYQGYVAPAARKRAMMRRGGADSGERPHPQSRPPLNVKSLTLGASAAFSFLFAIDPPSKNWRMCDGQDLDTE